ncbi:MAG: GTP 3',8-cyclase MoaA, partial [Rhodoferax sp.]
SAQVVERINAAFPLAPVQANYAGETAERWRYVDSAGEIGVISSVTHAFCGDCNRARLSTEGKLFLCLFAAQGYDLRSLVRAPTSEASDADLASAIAHIWAGRTDRYSELRSAMAPDAGTGGRRIEMSYIGG